MVYYPPRPCLVGSACSDHLPSLLTVPPPCHYPIPDFFNQVDHDVQAGSSSIDVFATLLRLIIEHVDTTAKRTLFNIDCFRRGGWMSLHGLLEAFPSFRL